MPIYDYKCPKCHKNSEISYIWNTQPIKYFCNNCNIELKKQVSKPSVHFKGTGFYETDYKGK